MNPTPEDMLDACRAFGIEDWICRAQYAYPTDPGNRPDIMPDGRTATVERIIERAEVWARALP